MVYVDIDQENDHLINQLNHHLAKKNAATFILFYMDGCGPCNATRPEWKKLQQNERVSQIPETAIVAMNHILANKLHGVEEPMSFPTIRFMRDGLVENYEDAEVPDVKDRTIDSFVEWIESKTKSKSLPSKSSKPNKLKKNKKTAKKKKQSGGKWSRKYKRSINCRRPRGFSQRQYCKYGRH